MSQGDKCAICAYDVDMVRAESLARPATGAVRGGLDELTLDLLRERQRRLSAAFHLQRVLHDLANHFHAIRASVIVPSMFGGLLLYGALSAAQVPVFFFYGIVAGTGQLFHDNLPRLVGALLGRYYFARRFGLTDWRKYSPVLLAGFACGMGLIAMIAIALGLIFKSVSFLPF